MAEGSSNAQSPARAGIAERYAREWLAAQAAAAMRRTMQRAGCYALARAGDGLCR